jgi:hypothetical protein
MSKLFQLKKWLTLPDAAKYLSVSFGEEVKESDILQLALGRHLKLSIDFVNHARAKRADVVSWEDTQWTMFPKVFFGSKPDSITLEPRETREAPSNLTVVMGELSEAERENFSPLMTSLNIGNGQYLNIDSKVQSISGLWDLTMIGAERLDVEFLYQQMTGGPEVTLIGMDGAFVQKENDVIYQLMEDFDDNEYQSGSKAQLRELESRILAEKLSDEEASGLLEKHKKDRKVFLENRASEDKSNQYYPAAGLPKDAVLVIRTDALRDFEKSLDAQNRTPDKPITTTERNTLLTLIAALCNYSDIDLNKRGIANQLMEMTQEIGAPITDDTVRKIISQIPDAVEARKK